MKATRSDSEVVDLVVKATRSDSEVVDLVVIVTGNLTVYSKTVGEKITHLLCQIVILNFASSYPSVGAKTT